MDPAEPQDQPGSTGLTRDLIWNVLTILTLVAVGCMVIMFVMIYLNPNQSVNPLQPPTPVPTTAVPLPTSTLRQFPATWTPTVSPTPLPTHTPGPVEATPTETMITPVVESSASAGQETPAAGSSSGYPFTAVTPIQAISSTFLYPSNGCNWAGIGGRVMDSQGAPFTSVLIQLTGTYNDQPVSMTALSGTQLDYGQSGYEFVLGDTPVASHETLYLQLFNQENVPLSDKVYVDTFEECDKNMLLVNFTQVR